MWPKRHKGQGQRSRGHGQWPQGQGQTRGPNEDRWAHINVNLLLLFFVWFLFLVCPQHVEKRQFFGIIGKKKKKNIKLCTTVQSFFFLARHESPLRDLLTMKYIADCPNKNMNIIDSSYKCMIWQHMRFVFVFDSEKDITTLVIYQGFCYTGIMRVQCILRETVPSSQF